MGAYTNRKRLFKTGPDHVIMVVLFATAIALIIFQGFVAQSASTGKSSNNDPDWETLNQHIAFHRLDEAVTVANRLIARYPDNPQGFYCPGIASHLKGNYDQALKDFDHFIALKPVRATLEHIMLSSEKTAGFINK